MSTHRKIDPDAGGAYLMKLLAEEEAERLDSLTDEEFLAERKAKARDGWPTPSAEELIAKVKTRAAEPARSGARPALRKDERVAFAADPVAPVERLAPRRRRTFVTLLAAAILLGVFVVAAKGPAIVALLRGDQEHEKISPEPPATPQEVAAKLRHDAIGQCEQGAWGSCKDKLDEARRLDPAGESDPAVQRLRTAIDAVDHPPQEQRDGRKPAP
jgi:hypothetical protein